MGRRPTGANVLAAARRQLRDATTADELRIALAVAMPLEHALSLKETAELVGRSEAWVARERRRYINGERTAIGVRGGRRNALLGPEEEIQIVRRGIMLSAYTWERARPKIRELIEEKVGRPVADSTLDSIIARVARKTVPGGTAADLRQLDRVLTEKWLRERVLLQKTTGRKLAV
jgi:transposase